MAPKSKKDSPNAGTDADKIAATAVIGDKGENKAKPSPPPRKCRDITFCLLFFLHILIFIGVAVISIVYGDVNRLRYGRDSFGNLCGVKSTNVPVDGSEATEAFFDGRDRPYTAYLFTIFDIEAAVSAGININSAKKLASDTKRVCVSKCPREKDIICNYDTIQSTEPLVLANQLKNSTCYINHFNTSSVLRRCFPKDLVKSIVETSKQQNSTLSAAYSAISEEINSSSLASKILQGLTDSWKMLIGSAIVALVISFIWLVLLSVFSWLIIWLTVFMAVFSSCVSTGFFWYNYYLILKTGQALSTGVAAVDTKIMNQNTVLTIAIVCSVVMLIILILLAICFKRIRLSLVVIKETSKALRYMPLIFFFPLFKYVVFAFIIAVYIVVLGLLSTSGTTAVSAAIVEVNGLNSKLPIVTQRFTPTQWVQYMQIYVLFSFFWVMAFIIGLWQTSIAGAVASWYWMTDKKNKVINNRALVIESLHRTLRYSMGSVAFGSLVIALFKMMRLLLVYLQYQAKQSKNVIAQYIISCLQCCFFCIEKIVKMLTRRAYVEIAVYGYSFCTAARHALELVSRNAFRIAVIDGVTFIVMFFGKILITMLTLLCAFVYVNQRMQNSSFDIGGEGSDADDGDTAQMFTYYGLPLLIVVLIAWSAATLFVTVMEMAIDTIFMCFCEDSERNDGSDQRPYFMSPELRAFVESHQEVLVGDKAA